MIDSLTQVAVANPDTGYWTVLTHDRQHGFVNEISQAPDGSRLYFDRAIAGYPVPPKVLNFLNGLKLERI